MPYQLSDDGARALQEMLPHPAADSGFGTMLFKAQLSTSRLRANLEQEYQATINFVFKALLEVCSCLHDAVADSDLVISPTLAIAPRLAECQPLAFWLQLCSVWQAAALHLTVIFSHHLPDILSMQTVLLVHSLCSACWQQRLPWLA